MRGQAIQHNPWWLCVGQGLEVLRVGEMPMVWRARAAHRVSLDRHLEWCVAEALRARIETR